MQQHSLENANISHSLRVTVTVMTVTILTVAVVKVTVLTVIAVQ